MKKMRRDAILIDDDGEQVRIADLVRKHNISYNALYTRLIKKKLSLKEALALPYVHKEKYAKLRRGAGR